MENQQEQEIQQETTSSAEKKAKKENRLSFTLSVQPQSEVAKFINRYYETHQGCTFASLVEYLMNEFIASQSRNDESNKANEQLAQLMQENERLVSEINETNTLLADERMKNEQIENGRSELSEIVNSLQEKLALAEQESEKWKLEANEAGRNAMQNTIQSEEDCKKAYQQGYETAFAEAQAQSLKLGKGDCIVHLKPIARELMNATTALLSRKLNTEVTPQQVLTDLFVKYTALRPADFAYPFVISKDEYQRIVSQFKTEQE